MATLKKIDAVTEVVEVSPAKVVIELSADEAQMLAAILGHFEAAASKSFVYDFYNTLYDEGFRGYDHYRVYAHTGDVAPTLSLREC